MAYKVLVVDDEAQIHTFMRISLEAEGFEYIGASSITTALAQYRGQQPHILILDLGLPDGDGIELLQTLRRNDKIPVLVLTARDQEEEKIRLLDAGANDYLSKPFGIRELIARIKVLVRDLVDESSLSDVLHFATLKLQKSTHQLWINKQEIALTKKEFALMETLMSHPGQLVKQTVLLQKIWGETHQEDSHYLRILVSQLRKKLNDNNEQQLIKTEAGLGYRLTDINQQ
ncbi:response regulator transcription factor [Shewanella putrefaciens]|uniref:Response regulator transcription factor n=1 Tax=Shewanella putrefaciens TaxID=24 RepID=A0ABX8XC27_SHEPU|nr:response regulator transcription factor [Shewanella putrefaciens]AVV84589.1 transcriptional regulator [Shewanella putrefaciens]MCT8943888.1 response regulator transcription factor [Shewanella putrefaciens]QSE49404.1 response regulator transcription factor [Shewanella putrefaciens]QYX72813.1 response regulator transcription factor [Shewanella putrefaciens]GGN26491.1 DNA-binding response regulator [Shewanella putrefaciens]